MDVALCLTGQMRTYRECYTYLKENIIEPLKPDIFIFTENITGISNHAIDDSGHRNESVTYETLNTLYQPKKVKIIEPLNQHKSSFKGVEVPEILKEHEPNHWHGSIPYFYKICKCNDLKKEVEQENSFRYDMVIHTRPDLRIREKLPQLVTSDLDKLWHSIALEKGVSDKLAVSNSDNMNYYASVWDHLTEYWKNPLGNGGPMTHRVGVRLLNHHMAQSNIEVRRFDIEAEVLRSRSFLRNKIRHDMKLSNAITIENCIKAFKEPVRAFEYVKRRL